MLGVYLFRRPPEDPTVDAEGFPTSVLNEVGRSAGLLLILVHDTPKPKPSTPTALLIAPESTFVTSR